MNCNICLTGENAFLFKGEILSKYEISYFKCGTCGAIQTESPYWLEEAYQEAITQTDIGLLARNIELSQVVYRLVSRHLTTTGKFLDYGGGYGILVRLLRDRGLDFYRQDTYCKNLFALNHDIGDLKESDRHFALVTCFEVFEHVYDPRALVKQLAVYADNILFSTLIIPERTIRSPDDWWYFAAVTGQHITLYTVSSLEILAAEAGMQFYSDGQSLHLLTRKKMKRNPLLHRPSVLDRILRRISVTLQPGAHQVLPSLTAQDLAIVREKQKKQD